jgi:hypothetical protein
MFPGGVASRVVAEMHGIGGSLVEVGTRLAWGTALKGRAI